MVDDEAGEQAGFDDFTLSEDTEEDTKNAAPGTPDRFSVARSEAYEVAAETARDVQRYLIGSETVEGDATLPGLAGRLITQAGSYPGKYDPPTALSTHLLNAIVTGVNAYVYDRVVRQDMSADDDEARLLVAALALHDANKYVDNAYDVPFETDSNMSDLLEYYWEQGDDFGLRAVLPGETEAELDRDIRDVNWLVQRTETKEDATETRGESTRRVRGLERYCRIGDGFVSTVAADDLAAGADWLQKFFPTDEQAHVQYLEFTAIEQPILNNHLLALIKDTVGMASPNSPIKAPVHGVVMGSTSNAVLYLGAPIDRDALRAEVSDSLMDRVTSEHEFHAKTGWNAFEYDILETLDIPFEEKRRTIADGYVANLVRGSGLGGALEDGFESVPDAFAAELPELVKVVYLDQDYEVAFAEYPALQAVWDETLDDDEYNSQTRKMGFLAKLLQYYMGADETTADPAAVRDQLSAFSEAVRDALLEDLKTDVDAASLLIERFFDAGLEQDLTLPEGDRMCFLCGREATREFKKGTDAFYQSQSFSKRVGPEGTYKRICPACNLEHALLRDAIEAHDYSIGADIEIAFVYYDAFVANLTIGGQRESDRLVRTLQGGTDDDIAIADPELVASSFAPQYHFQPFYVDSENSRLRAVRSFLETLVSRGFKVLVGKPFTGFRPEDALFADLTPTRRQSAYGAARIESFEKLDRIRRLFDILRAAAGPDDVQGDREFLGIQQDTFPALADYVVQNTEWYAGVREQMHRYLIDGHQHTQYMKMREVAREGLDLYGKQYDSPHKKTKVFRLAIDATLDGLNRDKESEELLEHVAGQVYKSAQNEDYAGRVTTDDATCFVETLFEYLRTDRSFDKQALSKRRNTLANTYLFAYDQLLSEDDESSDEAAEKPAT